VEWSGETVYEYYFLLVYCCYNVSIQHCFLDNTNFLVCVTACDLEKSFIFDSKI